MIPVVFSVLLRRQRKRLNMPIVIGRYGSIFVDYAPTRFYWESVVMSEKLMMAVTLTFFTKYTSAQLLAFLLVTVMGLASHIVAYPFFVARYNTLQTILRWCSCLVIVAGMLFNAGQFPDEFLRDLVTYGVFGIIGGSTLLVFGIVVYDIIIIRRSLSTKFSPGAATAMDKIITPQGKTLLMEWLGAGIDPGIGELFDAVIDDIGAFYLSGRHFAEVGLRPGEEIPDAAIREFCGAVFITPAVPAARRWFERNLDTAAAVVRAVEREGRRAQPPADLALAASCLARLRAFHLCFSQRSKYQFYASRGAVPLALAEGGIDRYAEPAWLLTMARRLGVKPGEGWLEADHDAAIGAAAGGDDDDDEDYEFLG
jgi:hypothetical protein